MPYSPEIQDLFQNVYDNPNDDQPRLELAEKLLEEGNYYGEFIKLQIEDYKRGKVTRESRSRQKQLRNQHLDEWIAPLKSTITKKSIKWERGFPVSGTLSFGKAYEDLEPWIGTKALATLKMLDVGSKNVMHEKEWLKRFIFQSPLRNLEVLTGARRAFFTDFLSSEKPWNLKELAFETQGGGGVEGEKAEVAEIKHTGELAKEQTGLPHLKKLQITYIHHPEIESFSWLWQTDFGKQLEHLTMNSQLFELYRWLPKIEQYSRDINLKTIQLFPNEPYTLYRSDKGWKLLEVKLKKKIQQYDKVSREAREKGLKKMIPKFNELGVEVTVENPLFLKF